MQIPMRIFGRMAKASGVPALLLLCALLVPGLARAAEPIKVGMTMALTGGVAPIGKQVLAALSIWRDDVNAKGGLLGRPVQLVYLRRSEQSRQHSRPLYEADRRRQSRPTDRPLRDQHGGAGDSGVDAAQKDDDRHPGQRRQQQVPLQPIFLDAADRAGAAEVVCLRFLQARGGAESAAEDGGHRRRRRGVRAERGRRRTAVNQGDRRFPAPRRPEIPTVDHRLCADHARRSGAQSRHCLCGRLSARTRSASCAPPTKSGSRRKCSAAPSSASW